MDDPDQDTYSQADIDDDNEFGAMSAAERRLAEREMERRDRGLSGGGSFRVVREFGTSFTDWFLAGRAARRSRAPAFLQSSDDPAAEGEGLLDGIDDRRRRRHYDERRDEDDMDGEEDVCTGRRRPLITHCM